jgi:predicted RNA binding protein YcfA (HicA-like mRNA interferase family)
MVKGFYHDVIKALKSVGYEYQQSAKGSHEKWVNLSSNHTIIVPRNCLSPHTANGILKSAFNPQAISVRLA